MGCRELVGLVGCAYRNPVVRCVSVVLAIGIVWCLLSFVVYSALGGQIRYTLSLTWILAGFEIIASLVALVHYGRTVICIRVFCDSLPLGSSDEYRDRREELTAFWPVGCLVSWAVAIPTLLTIQPSSLFNEQAVVWLIIGTFLISIFVGGAIFAFIRAVAGAWHWCYGRYQTEVRANSMSTISNPPRPMLVPPDSPPPPPRSFAVNDDVTINPPTPLQTLFQNTNSHPNAT
jgi:hypothetical protein